MLIACLLACVPCLASATQAFADDATIEVAENEPAGGTDDPSDELAVIEANAEDEAADNSSTMDVTATDDEADANKADNADKQDDTTGYLKDASGKIITGAGWHLLNGKWYYTDAKGIFSTNFQKIGAKTYYFDVNGVMATDWKTIESFRYYFGNANDGSMKTGWNKIGTLWYYFDGSGKLQTGWKTISSKTYYLDGAKNGAMATGWSKTAIDSKWHYFGLANDGAVRTGWLFLHNTWYYLDPTTDANGGKGAMVTGWGININKSGKDYYFGGADDGSMKSGWQKLAAPLAKDAAANWYYFGAPGDGALKKNQWVWSYNKWYHVDAQGAMQLGKQTVNGKVYYFDENPDHGYMLSGWHQIDATINNETAKKWYYFNGPSDGSMKTGWLYYNNNWFYLDPAKGESYGVMYDDTYGLPTIDGSKYSFDKDGVMASNAKIDLGNNECGYATRSGNIIKIGVNKDSKIILKPGENILTGWQKIGNTWFYADSAGVIQTDWFYSGGVWYYLQEPCGAMATGSCPVKGVMNYFEEGGAWNAEKTNMVKRAQGFSSRTGYLVLVDVGACRVGVFTGSQNHWSLIRYEPCVCGAGGSPTIRGTYSTGYHLYRLPDWSNALYCTNITGGYFFHSILNSTSELGYHLSHGCVRLNWPFAQYMQTLPYGSTVNLY